MQLSDDILLSKIIIGNAYNDEISLEGKTGKTQAKYKIHLCEIAGVYFFNKITKNKKSCHRKFTIECFLQIKIPHFCKNFSPGTCGEFF